MNLIIGKGQLGMALYKALAKRGKMVHLCPGRYPDEKFISEIKGLRDATVWNCVGAGSVEAAKQDFDRALSLHVGLPQMLMLNLDKSCQLVNFSSDYALDPTLSEYALTKHTMESLHQVYHQDRSACLRITSLYGSYRPLSCFPGKLLQNFPSPTTVFLPTNHVTPTPVDWLADRLVMDLQAYISPDVHEVVPEGSVSLLNWGRMILGEHYEILARPDNHRPVNALLQDYLAIEDTWEDLWTTYSKSTLDAAHTALRDGSTTTSRINPALFNGT